MVDLWLTPLRNGLTKKSIKRKATREKANMVAVVKEAAVEVVTAEEVVYKDTVTFMDAADEVAMEAEDSKSKSNSDNYWCIAHH